MKLKSDKITEKDRIRQDCCLLELSLDFVGSIPYVTVTSISILKFYETQISPNHKVQETILTSDPCLNPNHFGECIFKLWNSTINGGGNVWDTFNSQIHHEPC